MVFKNSTNETMKNLQKWLLFDTASTTHLVSNKDLVKDIQQDQSTQNIVSNGGELAMNQTAMLKGVGRVPFNQQGIANLTEYGKID